MLSAPATGPCTGSIRRKPRRDNPSSSTPRRHRSRSPSSSPPRPDDITHTQQFRGDFRGDGTALERGAEDFLRHVLPQPEGRHEGLVSQSNSEAGEDGGGIGLAY